MNLRDPHVQKGLAGIILVIALVWLIFLSEYLPICYKVDAQKLGTVQTELQQVAAELQRLRAAAANLPRLERELAEMRARWDALSGLLPLESEMAALLSEVTTAGMRAGVQFVHFEPQPPQQMDLFQEHPVRLAVTGGYHQVGVFFDNLCNLSRIVDISDITFLELTEAEEGTVEARATVSAYTFSRQPQVPGEGQQAANQKQKGK
ncbi:MAG: type 4a pilus biogenesis protein PilO [bacterium]|jgi:type IV pilus assembly protein PilO